MRATDSKKIKLLIMQGAAVTDIYDNRPLPILFFFAVITSSLISERASAQSDEKAAVMSPTAGYIQLYQLAQQQFDLKLYADALKTIDQAIQGEPQVAEGHNFKGACLTKLNDFDAAVRSFQNAASLNPKLEPMVHYNTGEIYFLQGQYTEAISFYQQFLKSKPAMTQTRLARLKVLLSQIKLGNMEAARANKSQIPLSAQDPAHYWQRQPSTLNLENERKQRH